MKVKVLQKHPGEGQFPTFLKGTNESGQTGWIPAEICITH